MLAVIVDGGDAAGKSSCVERVAAFREMRDVRVFHHRSHREGATWEEAARDYRQQREALFTRNPPVVIAARWWHSTLALSVVLGHDADAMADAEDLDARHAVIVARARALRKIALDERDDHEERGVRVVAVYLRASLATLQSRTSPSRRGGTRWRALPATLAAYEALAPTWCQHVVDAEQRPERVAADVAAIVARERRR
jgi:polyphosphate kinase 2 (PPK2 family)